MYRFAGNRRAQVAFLQDRRRLSRLPTFLPLALALALSGGSKASDRAGAPRDSHILERVTRGGPALGRSDARGRVFDVRLPDRYTDVSVFTSGGTSLELRPIGCAPAVATEDGEARTYRGIRPGVDASLRTTAGAARSSLRVADPSNSRFAFELRLPEEAVVARRADGAVESRLAPGSGMRIEPPVVSASNGVVSRTAASWTLTGEGASRVLELGIDAAGLAYPIVVDFTIVPVSGMREPRAGHTATLLPNGTVLFAGGAGNGGSALVSAELYDPATGRSRATASLGVGRVHHSATLLPSGEVLVVGGDSLSASSSAELFDPRSETWTLLPGIPAPLSRHTATLLRDGDVLLVGGGASYRYVPSSGAWSPATSMSRIRGGHTATRLLDGRVVVAGGDDGEVAFGDFEVFDPATSTWTSPALSMARPRTGHNATLLADGRILLSGGLSWVDGVAVPAAWVPSTGAPECLSLASGCDSGALLLGRDGIAGGAEPNQPNTIAGSCADGTLGLYESDESLERIRVATMDGGPMVEEAVVRVDVTVWAYSSYAADALDVYFAADATNPSWQLVETLVPPAAGRNVLSTFLQLPSSPSGRQAFRGRFRFQGSPASCGAGSYDDHDDLVFRMSDAPSTPELLDLPALAVTALGSGWLGGQTNGTSTLRPDGSVVVCGGVRSGANLLLDVESGCSTFLPATQTWSYKALSTPRGDQTATLLPSGRVLLAGGFLLKEGAVVGGTVEVIGNDSAPGTWQSYAAAPFSSPATILKDGRVLMAGGTLDPVSGALGAPALADSGLWEIDTVTLLLDGRVLVAGSDEARAGLSRTLDPATGEWSAPTPMVAYRHQSQAALLADGRVLVTGGGGGSGTYVRVTEVFDPATGLWAPSGELSIGRVTHRMIRLRSGRVLVTGGFRETASLETNELFDPESGAWRLTGPFRLSRRGHTLTLLPSGGVLAAGGAQANAFLSSTEVFDPVTETWSPGPALLRTRGYHTSQYLQDGSILLAGGYNYSTDCLPFSFCPMKTAEILDPLSGTTSAATALFYARPWCQSVSLPDGRVLVMDFGEVSQNPYTADAFVPGGLVEARRPVLAPGAGTIVYGTPFSVSGTNLGGDSETGSGSTSSGSANYPLFQLRALANGDVRWLSPEGVTRFSDSPATYTFTHLPPDLDRGWYFLTVFTGGTPSKSQIVSVACSIGNVVGPQDVVAAIGGAASFSVSVEGGRSFQWQKDVTGSGGWLDIPGANSATYETSPVVGQDSGTRYRVLVTGNCSTVASAPATLIVADATPPSAQVVYPAGGEFWALSTVDQKRTQVVTWSMSDDVRVCRVEVSLRYSNDGGATWNGAAADVTAPVANRLPQVFGAGGACVYPGESTTSLTYRLPKTFPSGQAGSLYRVRVIATDHAGNSKVAESPNPFYIVSPNPDSVRTLIVHNVPRQAALQGLTAPDASALLSKLNELAGHPRVQGLVVDLSGVTTLGPLYAAWDGATGTTPAGLAANADAANALLFGAGGVHSHLRTILSTYSGVKYLVLVGDDRVIPFARIPDGTSLFPESWYSSQGGPTPSSSVGKALAIDQYLSDDPLAVLDPVGQSDVLDETFLPDLGVGRLVETAAEVSKTIATFIGQDGVLDLTQRDPATGHKVLVTGYDFLTNVAVQIRRRWKAALDVATPDASTAPVYGGLVGGDWGQPGSDPDPRRVLLFDALDGAPAGDPFPGPYAILALSGHATHFEEGVPGTGAQDIQGLAAAEIYGVDPLDPCVPAKADSLDLSGSVVYAVGCHGGLPVPGSCPGDDDESLDLPQSFLGGGAVAYVANTGFGWGLRHGIGYGARLAQLFTEQITSSTGTMAVGDVVRATKGRYYLETPRFDPYDRKSLMQWTLFGLPMYAVKTGASVEAADFPGPGSANLGPVIVSRAAAASASLPSNLTQLNLSFDLTAPGLYEKHDSSGQVLEAGSGCPDPEGCYYTLNGLVDRGTGSGDLPIQPYLIYDSRLSGTSQHGVLWKGGVYDEESPFKPVIGELISNGGNGGDHGSTPRASIIRPTSPRVVYGQDPSDCRPSDLELNSLTVAAGEALKGEASDPEYSIARRYRSIDLEVLYFNDRGTPTNNCDRTAPTLGPGPVSGQYHELSGSTLRWRVPATDASGVWRVLAVYNPNTTSAGTGAWTPVELLKDPTGTTCPVGSFCGETTVAGTTRLTYVLQAVDNRGNVSWLDYVPVTLPSSGVNPGLPLPVDVEIGGECSPPATPVLTAPAYAHAGQSGLVASAAEHAGSTYAWTVSANGSITSGQGTSSILFSADAPGPLQLTVTEAVAGCASTPGSATVIVQPPLLPATSFYTLTPCRVVNTRRSDYPTGLGAPSIGATGAPDRVFDLPAGTCGIPTTAKAVALNVTVADVGGSGYLALYPGDGTAPATSTINFALGQVKANNVFLPLASDGSGTVKVRSGATAPLNLLIDVVGYFE